MTYGGCYCKPYRNLLHDSPIQISYNDTYKLFQHPNSLAHYNSMFYLANFDHLTNQSDILGFSNTGVITKKYNLCSSFDKSKLKGKSISTITHYKDEQFIIGVFVPDSENYRQYWVVHFSGTSIVIDFSFKALGCQPEKEWEGNDIYYSKSEELFYVIMVHKDDKRSRIYTYDVSKLGEDARLSATRVLEDGLDAAQGESSYEIEGMAVYDGKKYVVANRKAEGNEADGIFKLFVEK